MSDSLPPELDFLPCGFITFTDSGIIQSINETLIQLLGYSEKGDLENKNIETIFTLASRLFNQTHFLPLLLLHGKATEIFLTLKRKDGQPFPVICNAVRKQEQGGSLHHCVFFPIEQRGKYEQELIQARKQAQDALNENKELIAAKKELESYRIDLDRRISRLSQVNEDMAQFSKVASHDLQEPIRKIAIWSDKVIIEHAAHFSEPTLKTIRNIHKECVRLRTLAVNLERYISLDKPSDRLSLVDLNGIVQNEFNAAAERSGQADISVMIAPLAAIEGHESQIRQLFYLLFENLIRFRAPVQPLTIQVTALIEKTNSYQSTREQYRYIDTLKIFLETNDGKDAKSKEFVYLINKKAIIQSVELDFGFASCRKILNNHFGSILAITDNNNTKVNLSLPLKQAE
jgi:sigma-B regulation protein RsbU (phosphoserine phosphatase)